MKRLALGLMTVAFTVAISATPATTQDKLVVGYGGGT